MNWIAVHMYADMDAMRQW